LARNASSASVAARDSATAAARDAVSAARGVLSACEFAVSCAAEVVGREIADRARGFYRSDPLACDALRDILGNPFRPVTFDPARVGAGAALSIARAIHA